MFLTLISKFYNYKYIFALSFFNSRSLKYDTIDNYNISHKGVMEYDHVRDIWFLPVYILNKNSNL